eukprot:Rhum_TRINITY_DN14677_c1_g1::Rhum_TRINITY_DN14677_c1_g1_i1::g.109509::m.109509
MAPVGDDAASAATTTTTTATTTPVAAPRMVSAFSDLLQAHDFEEKAGVYGLTYRIPVRTLPSWEYHHANQNATQNTLDEAQRVCALQNPPFRVASEERSLFKRRQQMEYAMYIGTFALGAAAGFQCGPRTVPRFVLNQELVVSRAKEFGAVAGGVLANWAAGHFQLIDPHRTLCDGLLLRTPLGDHLRAYYQQEASKDLGSPSIPGVCVTGWRGMRSKLTEWTDPNNPGSVYNLMSNV